ncbi:mitochondrial inner membrane protein OXA1L [Drosophila rhopaloa]|uniref:Mitochondrial inner membrane protein OXA1L n=1 Tax=Drosophila rhopaloa TaxID=1041015 RepID=A0A6P4FGF1_DRORH|nr:mitochondrial inner membrane protein OXA1L [Drosophila rhopaloa]
MLAHRMQLWRTTNAAVALSSAASRFPPQGAIEGRRDLHLQRITRGSALPLEITGKWSSPRQLRFASTGATAAAVSAGNSGEYMQAVSTTELVDLPDLPAAPTPPPTDGLDVLDVVNLAGEPSFASIGLGGWSPVGMVQNCMEFLHCTWDIPWWGAIAMGTLAVRTIIFPLVILAQRNSAKMNNNMPQMQMLQLKMTEARQSGNAIESARYAQEMMLFMREKGVNPMKNMLVPLAQAPLFISFFMGLRQMANTPVESMRDGGLFWFTDLTLADPFYLLPMITSATLYLTIEIGTDSARLSAANMNTMKYVLRALPLVIFPFTMNFPAAILTYWACSNFISLGQVALLRIPSVRDYFKIEKMLTHAPSALPPKKGFVGGMKESWDNMKITKEIEERQRLDEIRFAKAGKGPLVKTYKFDPTKAAKPISVEPHMRLKEPPNKQR